MTFNTGWTHEDSCIIRPERPPREGGLFTLTHSGVCHNYFLSSHCDLIFHVQFNKLYLTLRKTNSSISQHENIEEKTREDYYQNEDRHRRVTAAANMVLAFYKMK